MTPDISYTDRADTSVRPSWRANALYLNDEHRRVFDETKDIPGWQAYGDTYKLYEMAYFVGDVILELGIYGGRSAVVELKGALSNPERALPPQYFGLDLDPKAIRRGYDSLKAASLAERALLYRGTIADFAQEFAIQPTMVFVDADHTYENVKKDLAVLSMILAPGVTVLCHDYTNVENDTGDYGVRRAATEWEQSGYVEFRGIFGCAALFVTTAKCAGAPAARMSDADFEARRDALLRAYGVLPPAPPPAAANDFWRWRAGELERELAEVKASRAYRLAGSLGRAAGKLKTLVPGRARRTGPKAG